MKKQQKKQLKQIQNQAQQGRSMVEMLGVLAIVGVLSIGGIAGYSWGMDKHVANQILNEMNLNSLQLAMLLQKGNPDGVTLALGSPYDDDNPTFRTVNYGFQYGCGENAEVADPECEYINETRYFITALDLPERVQKMVAESAENLQYVTKVETDETDGFVTVFFDVDAGVTEYESRPEETEPHETESHYTPMPEVTEPTTTTTTEDTTPTTTTTTITEATTPETTTTTESTTVTLPTTESSTTTVTSTTLTTTTTFNGECRTNADCEENQYCHFSNSTSCTEQTGYGECRSNDTYSSTVSLKRFKPKKEYMTWWSAENFCESHNMRMLYISDLNCSGTGDHGICRESVNRDDISNKVIKLREKVGSYLYWLTSKDSCDAYVVNLNSAFVFNQSRNDNAYALCVEK